MADKLYYYVEGTFQNRISGRTESGLLGPFQTYEEAQDTGYEKSMAQIKILTFPTADLAQATRIWKGQRVSSGVDWDIAIQKVRHSGKDIGVTDENDEVTGKNYEPNLLE